MAYHAKLREEIKLAVNGQSYFKVINVGTTFKKSQEHWITLGEIMALLKTPANNPLNFVFNSIFLKLYILKFLTHKQKPKPSICHFVMINFFKLFSLYA